MIKRNNLYVGGGENNEVSEEFVGLTDNIEPHPEKGGIKLTGYLTYNCLSINEDASQVIIQLITSVKPEKIREKIHEILRKNVNGIFRIFSCQQCGHFGHVTFVNFIFR